jgi:cell wall-associated NlpC family hydrolase
MDFSRYINIPYKLKGRDFSGCDCYGLIYLIFKTEKGITLPDFYNIDYKEDWHKEGKNFILDAAGTLDKEVWSVVEEPYKLFDCLIFFLASKKIANHCGMYIGSNKFIHVYDSVSCIHYLDRSPARVYGAMRYKGLV